MTKRAKVGIIYLTVILCTLIMRITSGLDIYSKLGVNADVWFSLVIQILCFGVLPFTLYKLIPENGKKIQIKTLTDDFGFKKLNFANFLLTIIIAACMIIVATVISMLWQIIINLTGYKSVSSPTDYSTVGLLMLQLFISAFLPAFFEEFTHRGLLFAGYKNCGVKFVFVSALLFALMHQNIRQTGYAFFDGFIIALTVYYTGSIYSGMIIHFINNSLVSLGGYGEQNGGFFGFIPKIQEWFTSEIVGYVVFILLSVISVILLFLIFYYLRKQSIKERNVSEDIIDLGECDALPLKKDIYFIVVATIGSVATIFSFVWGLLR